MIQLYSLMWILGTFFGLIGLMRGWNKEIIASAGILLAMFTLLQFDPLFRGTLLLSFQREYAFLIQALVFMLVVYWAYQNRTFGRTVIGQRIGLQGSILGGVVGFVNGYLVGGTLWYFMDINEYPFSPYIVAPEPGSPSAEMIGWMPQLILTGGVGGSNEFMLILVIILFVLVLLVL